MRRRFSAVLVLDDLFCSFVVSNSLPSKTDQYGLRPNRLEFRDVTNLCWQTRAHIAKVELPEKEKNNQITGD
jgi:hypothetical protein